MLMHNQAYKTAEKIVFNLMKVTTYCMKAHFFFLGKWLVTSVHHFLKQRDLSSVCLDRFWNTRVNRDFRLCAALWASFKAPHGEESIESE